MFEIKVTSEASELVLIADVKSQLYITHTDDDTYLTALIPKARKAVEKYCRVAIGSQEITFLFDACGGTEYKLPYQPVISVDTVEFKNPLDVYEAATVTDDYTLDGVTNSHFTPGFSGRWKLVYTTGYTTIPEELKHAILLQCAYWYEHRGESGDGLCEAARTAAKGFIDYSWM